MRLAGKLRLSLFSFAVGLRFARQMSKNFSFLISTYGEGLNGRESAATCQIVHVPLWGNSDAELAHLGHRDTSFLRTIARKAYIGLCRLIAKPSPSTIDCHSICNSNWTAQQFKNRYGNNGRVSVIYPGASSHYFKPSIDSPEAWKRRDDAVVILGRIVPQKNLELAICIVDNLRKKYPSLKLRIAGHGSGTYFNNFLQVCKQYDFVEVYLNLERDELERLVHSCKYGLHCAEFEHYGIAALELQRLGCITFVPNSCGQAEVASNEAQKYVSLNDAVEKIERVIEMKQEDLDKLHLSRMKVVAEHDSSIFGMLFRKKIQEILSSSAPN